ncbi:transcriptional repressor [bacterium]|nr:transcriptional repressor [bacterium]
MKSNNPDFAELLREYGSKATPGRVTLLKVLWQEDKPISVAGLKKKLDPSFDEVTLYRALESLTASGLIREVDFRHGHAHYEMNALREHHHHIICTSCGRVEDTECRVQEAKLTKASAFRIITDHTAEFFGLCNSCIKTA